MSRIAETRELIESDAERLWHLRLRALDSEPKAFGASAEEHRRTPLDKYAARLQSGTRESFVMGALTGGSDLIGMAGFYRDQNVKEQHKGHIWGVFVEPSHRGRGIGRTLISAILDRARALRYLSQVQLSVATTQREARSLYFGFGFRGFGIERQALKVSNEYVDEEHMVLFL
jgi:ribosomal protein S18 acetylase RimI-like enzyme